MKTYAEAKKTAITITLDEAVANVLDATVKQGITGPIKISDLVDKVISECQCGDRNQARDALINEMRARGWHIGIPPSR
jgi:hypothetical protein